MIAALFLSACGGKSQESSRIYPLGDKVQVGHLIYTAHETQWLTQIQQDPTPRIPQDRFFLIRITAVNSGGGVAAVPNMVIENDQGKTYEELSNGDGVPQWVGYLREVRPADTIQGYVVFDAPAAHYKLRVMDETNEKAELIDIPLSFNSETPGVQLPTTDEPNIKKDIRH